MLGSRLNMKEFEISELKNLTSGAADSFPVRSFTLSPVDGENFRFKPGMFTSIFISPGDKLFRSYSIASSPHEKNIELMIELVNGKLTSILAKLKEGDTLFLTEPKGTFVYDPEKATKSIFLAAGIGIAPFFSMLRYTKFLGLERDVVLLYSVKHSLDILNAPELESYRSLGLREIITVTRDQQSNGWDGERGRINIEMIKKHALDFKERTFYICGGIKFVRDIVDELTISGIKDGEIRRDIWGE
ncbi:MAG: FAD-binding oxidoreductase [Candidatus Thermoplasmatota archaeon]|nr:FAD-binding oxidoreductase [Candidatus Thermoplasmatota archaeon]MCL5680746.1 FAD-binding oxidoreductase [Candidatus Thermoplasmatota archaeon]